MLSRPGKSTALCLAAKAFATNSPRIQDIQNTPRISIVDRSSAKLETKTCSFLRAITSDFSQLRSLNGPVLITGRTGFKGAWLTHLLAALDIPCVGASLQPEPDSMFAQIGTYWQDSREIR
jgi:hypothetical protein